MVHGLVADHVLAQPVAQVVKPVNLRGEFVEEHLQAVHAILDVTVV